MDCLIFATELEDNAQCITVLGAHRHSKSVDAFLNLKLAYYEKMALMTFTIKVMLP